MFLATEASVGFNMKQETLVVLLTLFTVTLSLPYKSSPDKRYVIRRGSLGQDNLASTLGSSNFRTMFDMLNYLKSLLEQNSKIEPEATPVNPDEIQDLISRPLGVFRDF